MEKNREVFLKVKGEVLICTSKTTCDICLKWIRKGEQYGYAKLGDEEYGDLYIIANCLDCLKETT